MFDFGVDVCTPRDFLRRSHLFVVKIFAFGADFKGGATTIRRASGPTACQTCAGTGTESAASRSEEEARGIVYRAVEARDSKWLGVKTGEMQF